MHNKNKKIRCNYSKYFYVLLIFITVNYLFSFAANLRISFWVTIFFLEKYNFYSSFSYYYYYHLGGKQFRLIKFIFSLFK